MFSGHDPVGTSQETSQGEGKVKIDYLWFGNAELNVSLLK